MLGGQQRRLRLERAVAELMVQLGFLRGDAVQAGHHQDAGQGGVDLLRARGVGPWCGRGVDGGAGHVLVCRGCRGCGASKRGCCRRKHQRRDWCRKEGTGGKRSVSVKGSRAGNLNFFVSAAGILLSLVQSPKRLANRGTELYEILCHLRNAVCCSKAGQHVGGMMFLFLSVHCLMGASDLWWGGLFPFFLLSFAVDLICVIRLIMRLSIVGSLCLIAN